MSSSYTLSNTSSFTITNAKKIASKLATDLLRMHRIYGFPSREDIPEYEEEMIQLLKSDYLKKVKYGFQRDNYWIEPTLEYTSADAFGLVYDDDDPGRVPRGKDISGASFHSFLEYNSKWSDLSETERQAFKNGLPFNRSTGEDAAFSGYFSSDKNYVSGGRSLSRSTLRSF